MKLTSRPRHVYARGYVLAKLAPQCLIVVRPWMDAEPHLQKWDRAHAPHVWVRQFDESLNVGDWCITAYVCRSGSQETVAIPIPVPR